MENITEIVCPNCGEKLPGDSVFCAKCGTRLNEDGQQEVQGVEQAAKPTGFFAKYKKIIGIAAAAVIIVLIVLFAVNTVQRTNLKKELLRDWCKVEGEKDSYILCVLDFSEKEVEYRLETGYAWMDTSLATYDYKVISGNKIKVLRYGDDWETFAIEFNDEKTIMITTPALTSTDAREVWVNLD